MLLNLIKCYFVPFCLNWRGQGKQSKRIFKSWHQNQRQYSSPANDWSNRQLEFFPSFFFLNLPFLTISKDPPYAKGMVFTRRNCGGGGDILAEMNIVWDLSSWRNNFWWFFLLSAFQFSTSVVDDWLFQILIIWDLICKCKIAKKKKKKIGNRCLGKKEFWIKKCKLNFGFMWHNISNISQIIARRLTSVFGMVNFQITFGWHFGS